MRIGAAQQELSRSNDERSVAPGKSYGPHADWLRRYSTTVLPKESRFWYIQGRRRSVMAGEDQHILFGLWMTRDRSIFLFLRRATRLQ